MDEKTVAAETVVGEIPVAELLDFVRKASEDQGWCSAAENFLDTSLGIRVKQVRIGSCDCPNCRPRGDEGYAKERFTPVDEAPAFVAKAAVAEMIREIRREHPGVARDAIVAAGKKWDIDVAPAYRVRVTVMLDAEELEEAGSGWETGERGEPIDLKDEDLRMAARYAIVDLRNDRVIVRVAK